MKQYINSTFVRIALLVVSLPRWRFCLLYCLYFSLLDTKTVLAQRAYKIACIGDSITEGFGLQTPGVESYPARLQSLLGTTALVRNYGLGGRTLVRNSPYSYWKEDYFKQSHDWLPNVVILDLGANDSRSETWSVYEKDFVSDYKDMIATYSDLSSEPVVFICTPCPVYKEGAGDINPGILATNIAPKVRHIAQELDVPLIDLQIRMSGYPQWFPDTVHPNSQGMAAMVAVISEGLAGGLPAGPPPTLRIYPSFGSGLIISWPSQWRGLILESTPSVGGSRPVWSIPESAIAYANGTAISMNIASTGSTREFRLRRP